MDIRHKICHIYYKNADFESNFWQKDSIYCCYMSAKFLSTCIMFIISCILSSVLWDNFLWMTLYLLCITQFDMCAVCVDLSQNIGFRVLKSIFCVTTKVRILSKLFHTFNLDGVVVTTGPTQRNACSSFPFLHHWHYSWNEGLYLHHDQATVINNE